jgi:hypothetical protein
MPFGIGENRIDNVRRKDIGIAKLTQNATEIAGVLVDVTQGLVIDVRAKGLEGTPKTPQPDSHLVGALRIIAPENDLPIVKYLLNRDTTGFNQCVSTGLLPLELRRH